MKHTVSLFVVVTLGFGLLLAPSTAAAAISRDDCLATGGQWRADASLPGGGSCFSTDTYSVPCSDILPPGAWVNTGGQRNFFTDRDGQRWPSQFEEGRTIWTGYQTLNDNGTQVDGICIESSEKRWSSYAPPTYGTSICSTNGKVTAAGPYVPVRSEKLTPRPGKFRSFKMLNTTPFGLSGKNLSDCLAVNGDGQLMSMLEDSWGLHAGLYSLVSEQGAKGFETIRYPNTAPYGARAGRVMAYDTFEFPVSGSTIWFQRGCDPKLFRHGSQINWFEAAERSSNCVNPETNPVSCKPGNGLSPVYRNGSVRTNSYLGEYRGSTEWTRPKFGQNGFSVPANGSLTLIDFFKDGKPTVAPRQGIDVNAVVWSTRFSLQDSASPALIGTPNKTDANSPDQPYVLSFSDKDGYNQGFDVAGKDGMLKENLRGTPLNQWMGLGSSRFAADLLGKETAADVQGKDMLLPGFAVAFSASSKSSHQWRVTPEYSALVDSTFSTPRLKTVNITLSNPNSFVMGYGSDTRITDQFNIRCVGSANPASLISIIPSTVG